MFFVVSPRKFVLMNIFTLGLYWTYWFYRNWSQYRNKTGERVLPLVRTFFGALFLYGLLNRVDRQLRLAGQHHAWSPFWLTFACILTGLLSIGANWMAGVMPLMHLVVLVLIIPSLWLCAIMQKSVNLCSGDPEGKSNSRFSASNWMWISLGILLWGANTYLILVSGPLWYPE